jgi:predicted protein tyrosine phosphatase
LAENKHEIKEPAKILFICSQNINRSLTAERIFRDEFDTRSAGVYTAEILKSKIDWADFIVVMELEHKEELMKQYPFCKKQIFILFIPDNYYFMNVKLVAKLEERMKIVQKAITALNNLKMEQRVLEHEVILNAKDEYEKVITETHKTLYDTRDKPKKPVFKSSLEREAA